MTSIKQTGLPPGCTCTIDFIYEMLWSLLVVTFPRQKDFFPCAVKFVADILHLFAAPKNPIIFFVTDDIGYQLYWSVLLLL